MTVQTKANTRRNRIRLIRRRDRVRKGLPLRTDAPRARRDIGDDERDLDTPDPDLIGVTDFADEFAR